MIKQVQTRTTKQFEDLLYSAKHTRQNLNDKLTNKRYIFHNYFIDSDFKKGYCQ